MAGEYAPQVAAAVVGVGAFQLLDVWKDHAPSLSDLRSAPEFDVTMRQRLMDADFLVGGLAFGIGLVYYLMTKDPTAMAIMLLVFGAVSAWHHAVLNAQPI